MRNLSDNNPNIEIILDEVFAKDVPHARQTLIMDVFSFNYTFLITANEKTKLEITLKYPFFSKTNSMKNDKLKEVISDLMPSSLTDSISTETQEGSIIFTINIPKAKSHIVELKDFLSNFTILFVTKSILTFGKAANVYIIDDNSLLFFEEKEENYLLVYGYRGRNTLDKYLLKSMATEISNQRKRKSGGGCPSVSYIEPPTELKSTSKHLLKNFNDENVSTCDSGFISFYVNKKESTAKDKVIKTVKLKTFLDFQMKGLRTMMNGKMRSAGSALGKVLARATIIP